MKTHQQRNVRRMRSLLSVLAALAFGCADSVNSQDDNVER